MVRRRLNSALRIALAGALLPAAAHAAETCAPPVAEATISLAVEHGSAFVPMTINGRPATFLLDTGAESTLLSTEAAKRLGLAAHYTYSRRIAGFGGVLPTGEVHPDSVLVGGLAMPGFFALVAAVQLARLRGEAADGLLGADILAEHDLDMDLLDRRLTLYAPVTCDAPPLPWGRGAHGTAAHVSMRRHLVFDVQIAGKVLPAFIDTGAQVSFIDGAAAARLGVDAAALRQDPTVNVRGVASGERGLRRHRFARLDVAGVGWTGPVLVVAPLGLDDADVILGADFLDSHRVWFAYRGRHLFVGAPS